MPDLIILAGPNGAGKSTLAPLLLRDRLELADYVDVYQSLATSWAV